MKWELIAFSLCCLNLYVDCDWKHDRRGHQRSWQSRDSANEITSRRRSDPPDHTKLIPMARYVLHSAGR